MLYTCLQVLGKTDACAKPYMRLYTNSRQMNEKKKKLCMDAPEFTHIKTV